MFAFGVNVFAKETITSANITVKSTKNEYNVGETAEFVIHLDNLVASKGIITFGASMEYNHDILELVEVEGTKGWGYNDNSSDIIAIFKSSNSSNSEDIATIRFNVLEPTATTSLSVKLNKIDISNGSGYKINSVSSNQITVKASQTENPPQGETTPPAQGETTPPSQGETTPPAQGEMTPPSQGETTPPAQGESTPPTQGETTPPSQSDTTPPQGGDIGQSGEDENIPNGDDEGNQDDTTTPPSSENKENQEDMHDGENSDGYDLMVNVGADGITSNDEEKSENDSKIPQLGARNPLGMTIIVAVIIAVILFIKMKIIDKKIKKSETDFYNNEK